MLIRIVLEKPILEVTDFSDNEMIYYAVTVLYKNAFKFEF